MSETELGHAAIVREQRNVHAFVVAFVRGRRRVEDWKRPPLASPTYSWACSCGAGSTRDTFDLAACMSAAEDHARTGDVPW